MRKLLNFWLDFIWPQFCLDCGKEGKICCDVCFKILELLPPDTKPWDKENNFSFNACYVCLDYDNNLVKKLIKYYKYNYLENLADFLTNILARQARKLHLPANTIITNIPLHKHKRKQRGFDQTEILAKKLAKQLNLEYQPLLKRVKKTKIQAQLSKQDRLKNIQGAFVLKKQISTTNTILLLDDIATTGATLNQASTILKQAGFSNIICLVLAKNSP